MSVARHTRALTIAEMTHVTSYRDVAAVLNSPHGRQALHSSSHTADEYGPGLVDAFTRDAIISLHGDEHFERRRLESRLFTKPARERIEFEIILPMIRSRLAEHLSHDDGPTDLMPFTRLVLTRLSGALIGTLPIDELETAERLRGLSETLTAAVASPWMEHVPSREAAMRAGLEARDAFAAEFYEPGRCAVDPEAADPSHGLISLLLCNPGAVASEEVMFREAVLYLLASSGTTSNALPHAIRELERWFETHLDAREGVASFEFCRRAASETLRLHPPNPGLLRYMAEPLTLPSGLELQAHEFVFVDLRRSGKDPEVFGADAAEFDPCRVVPKGVWPFAFTFGSGAHMCVGRTLSLGDAGAAEDDDAPQGVLTQLLHELYGWGVRLDPDAPPEFVPATARDDYEVFPVRFTTPRLAVPS
jgi:cytochrome P450